MDREAARSWISRCGCPGWVSLVDQVYDRLPPGLQVKQVYQKWAELRFDLTDYDEAFEKFLVEIAAQSATICGVCGGAGYHHCLDGWEETICDACRARAEMQIDGPPGSDDDFER